MPGLFAHMGKTFGIPCQDFVHPLPGLLRPCIKNENVILKTRYTIVRKFKIN